MSFLLRYSPHVLLILILALQPLAFKVYYKKGYEKGWSDKPQQVLTAPATIINESPKGYWYGATMGKNWGLGLCHR